MEDIIDIIVTETTNLIEITSQPTDEIIDVNIIDNREDITLNVTPSVVEININSLTGNFGVNWGDIDGTLSNQTDLQNALNLKADLVDGKVPSSQLPSYVDDIVEVATYSALPTTGETGKIYVVLDTNLIYRWSGSAYIEIKDSSAVWGAITGTLSSQTDLQNALNAKVPYTGATSNVNLGEYGATVGYLGFDTTPSGTPTGIGTMYWDSANRTVSLIDGDGDTTLQLGQEERVLVHNNTGSTLTDGQVVYVTGSTGELPSVALASNTTEATSSVTFGIVTESIANGADGFVTTSGIVHGLNTLALTEGAALWLGSTAGTFTETKPVAPANSVLIGYVIKKAGGNGSIFVKIQNGYELEELHDVLITSKANNQGLFYESSSGLWKNKSIATVLGYTPVQGTGDPGRYAMFTGSSTISYGFIQTLSNITYVEGLGLSTLNGLEITGNFGGGSGGLKLKSYDESTSKAYMEFINTSGVFRLGIEGSTGGGILPGSTAYATVLTSGLTAKNLEFGTNNTKRLTLDGTTGAATFTSSVTASALYVTGMTSGSGALYYSSGTNRVTVANYNASGIVSFEVNGGSTALTLNSNLSATFAGALSGTSATFSSSVTANNTITAIGTSTAGFVTSLLVKNPSTNAASAVKIGFDGGGTTWGEIGASYNSNSPYMAFFVRANSEKMRITDAGNVGIGTTAPANYTNYITQTINGANGAIVQLQSSGTPSLRLIGEGVDSYLDNVSTGALIFRTTSSSSERMRITSSGNVGIGTTAPLASLGIVSTNTYVLSLNNTAQDTRMQWLVNGTETFQISSSASQVNLYGAANIPMLFYTNGTERMRITSGGDTQIAAGKAIYCYGTDAKSYGWTNLADGNLSFTSVQFGVKATIGAFSGIYTPLSDINKKKDFELSTKGLESILGLKPTLYRYKDDVNNEYNKTLGFIAQEVNEFIPEAYVETGNVTTKFIGLDYNAIVATLVKAVQEQQAQIEELKNK